MKLSIKNKVIFLISICAILGSGLMAFILNDYFGKNSILLATQSIKEAKNAFENLQKNDIKTLSSTLESMLANEKLKELFNATDRDNLYNYTNPIFQKLKNSYGITLWNFIYPENALPEFANKQFLRVQNPKQFGDVVTRASYLNAVNTKKISTGLDLGKTGFILRSISPFYNNDKLLGYMEMGEDIGHFFNIMKEQTGNEYGLLLIKKYLNETDWADYRQNKGLSNNWNDNNDTVISETTSNNTGIIKYENNIESLPENGIVLEKYKKGNGVFVRGLFPIKDAEGRKVGAVFVIKDLSTEYLSMQKTKFSLIAYIIAIMMLFALILVLMLNSLVFSRLNKIINVITRVVGGDYENKIKSSADDEIGKFESLFEQFRALFVNILSDLETKNKK